MSTTLDTTLVADLAGQLSGSVIGPQDARFDELKDAFLARYEEGLLLRLAGDAIAVGPPFISTADEIAKMGEGIRRAIRHVFAQGNA